MSRLTDKYQSYAHFKGISFDESTFTTSPSQTGAKLYNGNSVVMGSFTNDGSHSPTVLTGVMPNQKYYEFEFDSGVTPNRTVRLIYGNTTSGNAGGLDDVRRLMWEGNLDRVTGYWVKTPTNYSADGTIPTFRWVSGAAPIFNISPGKVGSDFGIYFIHSTTEISPQSTTFYTSYTDQNSNVVTIQPDTWYFVAIRRRIVYDDPNLAVGTAQTGTLEQQHYINGELVGTVTRTSWTKRSVNGIIFGNNTLPVALGNVKLGVSSWFVADWSDIGQTQLREIYKYGAPIQTPIKYYDGTNWQDDASAPKVYYNGAWRDVYADRFDGTNWIPL